MAAMAFTATLLEKIPRSADTTSYRFSRPPEYAFSAGQWFNIAIPAGDETLEHQFSHADSPTEPHIELTTRLTGSAFKNTLDSLPVGTEAQVRGPFGRFLFAYDAPRVAFLTGGIGITPVRSMFRYLADTQGQGRVEGQELIMFYGSMTEDGIVYREELEDYERRIPGLRIVHVITNPGEAWRGYSGFITADIVRAELHETTGCLYYIVGPPAMLTAMDAVLDQLGVPNEQMVIESFAGYAS